MLSIFSFNVFSQTNSADTQDLISHTDNIDTTQDKKTDYSSAQCEMAVLYNDGSKKDEFFSGTKGYPLTEEEETSGVTIANKDFVLGNITLSPFVYSFDAQFSLIAMGISFKNAEGKTSTVSTNMTITSELQEKPAMKEQSSYLYWNDVHEITDCRWHGTDR